MILRGFKESARRYGWRPAAGQFVHKALARLGLIKSLHVLWLDRGNLAVAPSAQAGGVEVRRLVEEELERYAQDSSLDMEQAFIVRALANGGVCLGAFAEGALVAYVWFGRRNMELYPGLVVAVGDDVAYAYKGLTLPQHRKRGCLAGILRDALDLPVLPGTTRVISLVEAANLGSLAACARIGFERDGRLCLLGRAPQRRWFCVGGGKKVQPPRITATGAAEA